MCVKIIILMNLMHKVSDQFENEIQNLIAVYDDILKEMSKSAVRYSRSSR